MWNKIVAWHRALEAQQMAILEDPEIAETVPPGYRRLVASQLAKKSPVERQQMQEFLLKYAGWRGYAALAAVIALLSLMGILLHLMMPNKGLGAMILLTNAVGLVLLGGTLIAWFSYRTSIRILLRMFLVMVSLFAAGAVAVVALRAHERGIPLAELLSQRWSQLLFGICFGALTAATPLAIVVAVRNQQHRVLSAKLEIEAERERGARELSESRLRLLHAQIEPHFLFNTLGAVQQLAESDPPRAAALTAHLIDFLRASMAHMRSETETLRNDFALVDSYLQVMQARLGERLRYGITLPATLHQIAMPSMMLLTLAENAIKHGIEPSLQGGEISISAEQRGESVRICVRDTGVGLSSTPGAGEGLDNIRKRLHLIYPGVSALSIEEADTGGVLAVITIPFHPTRTSP